VRKMAAECILRTAAATVAPSHRQTAIAANEKFVHEFNGTKHAESAFL